MTACGDSANPQLFAPVGGDVVLTIV